MAEEETINVMLGDPGEDTWNTLVLGDTEVVIPLERDRDDDPFQDDEVWLCAADGTVVQRRYASDDEVEDDEEKNLFLYRFSHVRYGMYSVWTKVGGQAAEIMRGLVVRREGVFAGQSLLSEDRQGPAIAPDTGEDSGISEVPESLAGPEVVTDVDQSDDEDDDDEDDA
jgi:hypothetical protein